MTNLIKYIGFLFLALSPFFLLNCSTGIEGTKTITYSKNEKKELATTAEERFISAISADTLKTWQPGKRFLISDNRASRVFESKENLSTKNDSLKGKVIEFKSVFSRITPGGGNQLILSFTDGGTTYNYPTGKSREEALVSITSLDIPMLLDLDMVEQFRKKLKGETFWTRSRLWYDADGEKLAGRKFVPVTITDVSPGDMLFLLHLNITDEAGNSAVLYMNPVNRGMESRTFPNLFFLSDPKLKYPAIREEIWNLICRGLVTRGMTKEECKLALGNPDEVTTGHDWNQTVDIWNYKNGVFLQFLDGLLTRYRI